MDFLYFLTHTVFTNQVVAVDNTKTPAEVMRPDGVMIPSAVVGTSDEVTYWIPQDGGYVQVNDKEATAYADWLLNDMMASEKLNAERAGEKIAAEKILIDMAEQAAVQIVGSGWSPDAQIDYTGAGA